MLKGGLTISQQVTMSFKIAAISFGWFQVTSNIRYGSCIQIIYPKICVHNIDVLFSSMSASWWIHIYFTHSYRKSHTLLNAVQNIIWRQWNAISKYQLVWCKMLHFLQNHTYLPDRYINLFDAKCCTFHKTTPIYQTCFSQIFFVL